MEITTTRFGRLKVAADDIIRFPSGLPGYEDCRDWVLLAERRNEAVAWLQSVEQPAVALAVASPRRFVPGYQARVARRELTPLALRELRDALVLAILGKTDGGIALNLKAPIVINPDCRVGRQVITNGDLPVQYELFQNEPASLRIA